MLAWWSSAGKDLSFWLSACAVLLIVCVLFPFGVLDRVWNSMVAAPAHCFFIYRVSQNMLRFKILIKTQNLKFGYVFMCSYTIN